MIMFCLPFFLVIRKIVIEQCCKKFNSFCETIVLISVVYYRSYKTGIYKIFKILLPERISRLLVNNANFYEKSINLTLRKIYKTKLYSIFTCHKSYMFFKSMHSFITDMPKKLSHF